MATSLHLEKNKNDLENTIAPGKFSFLISKNDLIFFISLIDIFDPLYNSDSEAKGNALNLTPSYNILINGK